ncbi:MAG: efflux RND transporter periplasmic adaptor subunit [Acidobacteriia bacterium]|nr:efflux RND transporter periplasmic adaptor subunit [Terriglobia bacterium]
MGIRAYLDQHRKAVALAVVGLAALFTVGMVLRSRADSPKYLTATVKRGDITAVVQATGVINPLTTVPVGSSVSGTVKYIFADFNTRVRAGQVLAQLDPALYEAQVIQARGNLANAEANLRNLQASLSAMQAAVETNRANLARLQAAAQYARTNAARIADLSKQGILAQDQNDLTQANLLQADAQVRAAEAQIRQSQAQVDQTRAQVEQARAQVEVNRGALKQAETNFRYTTILSPIDGTVVARNITVGQSVAASLQAPNVFTIAQDLKRMQVYAKTDESDTGQIKIGAEVTFQVDAFPTEVFHGQVSAIRLNAYTVQNVVTYDTVIDFENADEKLLPGETAYVTIPTGHASDAVKIPSAALRYTPELPRQELQDLYAKNNIPASATVQRPGGLQVVWKLTGSKKLEPLAVKVGITDYSSTQMVEGSLKDGDVLVTGQTESANAGQPQGQFPGSPRFGGPGRR